MVKGVMGARSGFGMLLPSRRWLSALAGLAALSVAGPASATTISGSMTADDSFTAYLSTSDASLGTPIASGSNWGFPYSFSTVSLTPGQNYYLHIEAYDAAPPGGFIGSFTLSDSGFAFVNGSQTLDTNTTDWVGNINTGSWSAPSGTIVDFGGNGVGPWNRYPSIDGAALWIRPSDSLSDGGACALCTVDLSTEIISAATSMPEPASWVLMATALGGLGMVRRRAR